MPVHVPPPVLASDIFSRLGARPRQAQETGRFAARNPHFVTRAPTKICVIAVLFRPFSLQAIFLQRIRTRDQMVRLCKVRAVNANPIVGHAPVRNPDATRPGNNCAVKR